MSEEEFKEALSFLALAKRAVEKEVAHLDELTDRSAKIEDYSGAARNQAAAVNLHLAVDLIRQELFWHGCRLPGFNPMTDECRGCRYDRELRTTP